MTVTLPRALEVCGVTRSIRCPFKCVPYKSKLHCTMKSHITTFLYPTIPQLCPTVILKGKECKASSERAQGQRAAHKGRGSHLSTVVPLHICCRLLMGHHCLQNQYSQILTQATLFDQILLGTNNTETAPLIERLVSI